MQIRFPSQPNRRTASKATAALALSVLFSEPSTARPDEAANFRVGTCDWSIKMPLSEDAFRFAEDIHLNGIQYSFGKAGDGQDLRRRENRDAVRQAVKETGVAISSMGIGLLNKIPFASTDEAEQLVVECLETMALLYAEAAELDDRDLADKVSPRIVLLAFFGKGDINGHPELIESVIEKLKRIAPLAQRHGFILGLESLLDESDLRHIINSVASPAVKVYYDTGNSARMGYDIYGEIKSLGTEHICEIHLKENGNLIGEGDIDFERINQLLRSLRYEGWLIIEGSTPEGMSRTESCKLNAKNVFQRFK